MPSLTAASARTSALVVASVGTFLVMLAYTAIVPSIASTTAALHADAEGRAWFVSSMSIGLAASLLATGAVADVHGRRRAFVAGAIALAASSVLAALAPSIVLLVIARVLQGFGGAALTSCSLGILGATFHEPSERIHATAIWGASLGAGISAGPLVGAGLELAFDWRAVHWACALVAIAVAAAGSSMLVESRAASSTRVDYVGSVLLVLGSIALLGGLTELRGGAAGAATFALLALGLVGTGAFVASQKLRANRILDLALFRRADFTGATIAAFATGLGVISTMSFLPTLAVRALGIGLFPAATLVVVWSALSVVSSIAVRKAPNVGSPRMRLAVGLGGVGIGQLALAFVAPSSSYASLVPALVVAGVASGVLNSTLARQAVASVPRDAAAMGSGANNSARYLGAAFGLTLVAMIVKGSDAASFAASWNFATRIGAGFSFVGMMIVLACRWPTKDTG
ncbi:MAG TPA: MFS transporter [Polyangiaceae bacterium]